MSRAETFLRQTRTLLPESLKQQVKKALGVPGVESSLLNMKRNGFNPNTVIDVGAYTGEWTRLCKEIFPGAQILMIEPQAEREAQLKRLTTELSDVSLVSALLGPSVQTKVPFYAKDSASSVLVEAGSSSLPSSFSAMTTLTEITKDTIFARPNFLKLDVQGYELKVLEGGEEVLSAAEAVLMEVNLIEIYEGAPLFDEAVAFMAARGFRVYDICTFFRRPYDGALWQLDVIFLKQSSNLLSIKRWA